MKISPYANVSDMLKDAQTILSNKKLWTDAKDDATRENIRFQTEPIYERLRRNGYGDVAKNLTDSDYEQAVSVVDALSKNNEPLRKVTYTPESDIENIYNNKERWGNATDEKEKNNIAAQTQGYYNNLIQNGYNDVAHSLATANYQQSKPIYDKWMKMGKTTTRDYLYTLGQKYGMSTDDVDKLIQWDNDSKELTFGGVKVGSPDAIVDGVSYWTENNLPKLDKAFNDYISASGTTLSSSKLVDLNNTGVNQKIDELWGRINGDRDKYYSEYDKVSDYANRDVTKTDEYQSTFKNIMGKYDLSAMQGRDNAVATGGASNGGNIDSYAAANAMRQQAAITAQGQALAHQLGLEAYQSRMDNTRQLLSDLGIYQKDSWGAMGDVIGIQQDEAQRLFENNESNDQRLFENDQTAKNNETARLSEQATVTGFTPKQWLADMSDVQTEAGRQFDKQDATAREALKAEVASNTADAEATKYASDKELEATKYATDKELEATKYTVDNSVTTTKPSMTIDQVNEAIENGNITQGVIDAYNYYNKTNHTLDNPPSLDGSTPSSSPSDNESEDKEWNEFCDSFWKDKTQRFLSDKVYNLYKTWDERLPNGENRYSFEELSEKLKSAILDNSEQYDIDVEDARRICNKFDVDTTWLNDYRNRWGINGSKGMIKK